MSDEEYVYGSDEDYCYGSENEEEPQDDLIEIENAFYEGDDCKTDQPAKALEMFAKVVELETERGTEVKWRFKALEHLVVLHFRLGQFAQMVGCYQGLLSYVGQVTRNECTDSINNILDTVRHHMPDFISFCINPKVWLACKIQVSGCPDLETVSKMYEVTLDALRTAGNERMWFSTNAKLAKAYLQQGNHARANRTINELHRSCQLPDGSDDPSKGSSLLEVYGLVIQLCTATMNTTLMKEVYPKIEKLNAVRFPLALGSGVLTQTDAGVPFAGCGRPKDDGCYSRGRWKSKSDRTRFRSLFLLGLTRTLPILQDVHVKGPVELGL
jgi:COP9 signalosome complex subunit 2